MCVGWTGVPASGPGQYCVHLHTSWRLTDSKRTHTHIHTHHISTPSFLMLSATHPPSSNLSTNPVSPSWFVLIFSPNKTERQWKTARDRMVSALYLPLGSMDGVTSGRIQRSSRLADVQMDSPETFTNHSQSRLQTAKFPFSFVYVWTSCFFSRFLNE